MFYAAAKRVTLSEAVRELQKRSLLDLQGEKLDTYVACCELQARLCAFLRDKSAQVRQGVGGGANAVLDLYGLRFADRIQKGVAPHAIPFSAIDLDTYLLPVPDSAKETLQWLAKYSAWAMPARYGPWIGGMWVISVRGARYLPFIQDSRSYASGVGAIDSHTASVTVLDDPIEAFRLMMLSVAYDNKVHPYIVPVGITDAVETYRTQQVVFWSPRGQTHWLARAMCTPDVSAVDCLPKQALYTPGENFPFKGNHAQLQLNLHKLKETPHRALGQHLLRLAPDDARTALGGLKIDQSDRAKILNSESGPRKTLLSDLLRGAVSERSAVYNDQVITETARGWVCKGKLISDTMFYMDEIHPQPGTGDATLNGTVVSGGSAYQFEDQLSSIHKRTSAWLLEFMLHKTGCIPTVCKGWESKLFDISQAFKQPTPIKKQLGSRWEDGVLHLPNFSVDKNGIYKAANTVSGPRLPMPDSGLDMSWATNDTTCRIWLALAANIVRAYHLKACHGILLVDQTPLIARIAQSLGVDVIRNPTQAQLSAFRLNAIPAFIECDLDTLPSLFKCTDGHNVVVSVPQAVAELAQLQGSWQRIETGLRPVDVSAMPSIFAMIPELVRLPYVDDATFYRKLAEPLTAILRRPGVGGSRTGFIQAAAELDVLATGHSFASKFMLYLTAQAMAGNLPIAPTGEGIDVTVQAIGHLVAQGTVPMPPLRDIVQALVQAGFVLRVAGGILCISSPAWSFYQSTAKALV